MLESPFKAGAGEVSIHGKEPELQEDHTSKTRQNTKYNKNGHRSLHLGQKKGSLPYGF